ncbi:MAG: histidine kinase [Gammaproteobacteria bacterium]|jgi:two-component system sensor histidine kinase AlgZ
MNDVPTPGGRQPALAEVFFLPSFCNVRIVFAVVVITELIAFVVALVSPEILGDPWTDLGLVSLYMQWIALSSAALLCIARKWLTRLGNAAAALISYLLVLLVTASVSEMAFWIMNQSTVLPAFGTDQRPVFLLRSLIISTVISAVVLRYLFVQHQWRAQLRAETQARIQVLQARIRPHFLFNSMNTIASLIRSRPEIAEETIQDLSDLFRAALNQSHDRTTLAEELVLARRYLNIETLRLGERLAVEWNLEAVPLDVKVPPLLLQPLLENAIYHGIEPLPKGGTVRINGCLQDGRVSIEISNPVPGESEIRNPGNRIAQDNIRQRLELAFGSDAGLDVVQQGGEYRVVLGFPEERLS